jgi:hypothetical protein
MVDRPLESGPTRPLHFFASFWPCPGPCSNCSPALNTHDVINSQVGPGPLQSLAQGIPLESKSGSLLLLLSCYRSSSLRSIILAKHLPSASFHGPRRWRLRCISAQSLPTSRFTISYGYIERLNLFAFGISIAFVCLGAFLYFATLVLRDVKKYQKLKKYKSFVRSQAVRAGIITMIMACVTTFALSAMLRVPIKATLLNVFVELSLNGVACADQAAFVSAFEASSANASCPALPNCGYATYEDLCQAVQYAPMVRALTDDTFDVSLFILASWLIISILILGTGRARANDGYSHLLSPRVATLPWCWASCH